MLGSPRTIPPSPSVTPPFAQRRLAHAASPINIGFLREEAKRPEGVRKQLITVFDDAPEDFKELKKRSRAKRRVTTIKSSRRRTHDHKNITN